MSAKKVLNAGNTQIRVYEKSIVVDNHVLYGTIEEQASVLKQIIDTCYTDGYNS